MHPADFETAFLAIDRVRELAEQKHGVPVHVVGITNEATPDLLRLWATLSSGERFYVDVDMDCIDPILERVTH
jgi:hypothetical protein